MMSTQREGEGVLKMQMNADDGGRGVDPMYVDVIF